jgi:hypothetical protein
LLENLCPAIYRKLYGPVGPPTVGFMRQ